MNEEYEELSLSDIGWTWSEYKEGPFHRVELTHENGWKLEGSSGANFSELHGLIGEHSVSLSIYLTGWIAVSVSKLERDDFERMRFDDLCDALQWIEEKAKEES